jgi:hypothetical protein
MSTHSLRFDITPTATRGSGVRGQRTDDLIAPSAKDCGLAEVSLYPPSSCDVIRLLSGSPSTFVTERSGRSPAHAFRFDTIHLPMKNLQ